MVVTSSPGDPSPLPFVRKRRRVKFKRQSELLGAGGSSEEQGVGGSGEWKGQKGPVVPGTERRVVTKTLKNGIRDEDKINISKRGLRGSFLFFWGKLERKVHRSHFGGVCD